MATVQQERMPLSLEERPGDSGAFVHAGFVGAGLLAAVVMMWAIHVFAPEWVAVMLLDIHRSTYPITIQTFNGSPSASASGSSPCACWPHVPTAHSCAWGFCRRTR